MDRVIVQQFNRVTIKALGMDVYKDCYLMNRAAPGAQAILDFLGITERGGFSLQANWARLRLAFMLHTNVSHQQNTCLEAEGLMFITSIANESGLEYGRMLLTNKPGQKVNGKWVQLTSNALGRFEVFIQEVNQQADRRRAEFAVTTAPAMSHLPSLAPMAGGSAGGMLAMSRADTEHKRALSAVSGQAPSACADPQVGLRACKEMLLSFKLEDCPQGADTVVLSVQNVVAMCNGRNDGAASCWWTCVGSSCPFADAFTGHSNEDHGRVRPATRLEVLAKAQSAGALSRKQNLLGGK
jgi:hypothetical protein